MSSRLNGTLVKVTNKFRKSQIFYKKYSYSVRFSPYIILLSCEMQLTLVFWLRYKGTTRTIC